MTQATENRYQNTTLRMPKHVYERAKNAVNRFADSSFNEFVVEAIREKLDRLTEAQIDAAFAQMAEDDDYKQDSLKVAQEFERSDWDSFKMTESEQTPKTRVLAPKSPAVSRGRRASNPDVRPSKARSR